MIKVNLIPADILAKAQQKQRTLQVAMAGGAAVLLVALVSFAFLLRVKRLESKLAASEAEFARLSAVVAKVKEAENVASLLKARLKVIDDLDRGRRAYPYFMCDLTRSVPGGVRLTNLTTTGGNNFPIKLSFTAEAHSNEDIASWIRKMEESGRFSGMELGPVTLRDSADGVLRNFTMTAVYTPQL